MKKIIYLYTLILFGLSFFLSCDNAGEIINYNGSVKVNSQGYIIGGKYKLLRGGTLQWFRISPEEWEDRIKRFKAAGFNTIDMYIAWNLHEPEEGVFDFKNPDIIKFLDLVKKHGLYIYFRPVPYFCNEYNGGGIPSWILVNSTKKNKKSDSRPNLRTDDPDYIFYVKRYLNEVNKVIKPYLHSKGGPIILYGIENEYDWFEIFHEADKLFWYEGGPERNPLDTTGTSEYFTIMRDTVLADGIDVPLSTCPGNAYVKGMGNVSGIIPMPNHYDWNGIKVETEVDNLLHSMHDPGKYGGIYTNYPSASTETFRIASRMKRMLIAGMDGFFAFNIVGMAHEGYNNPLMVHTQVVKDLTKLIDFSNENFANLFFSPTMCYYPNVNDYYGAISPSGVHREKFYHFRRGNLFFNDFEHMIGPISHANISNQNDRNAVVKVRSSDIGVHENGKRFIYWMQNGDTRFISLLNERITNEKLRPVVLPPMSITVGKNSFPKYTELTVPIEFFPGNNESLPKKTEINVISYDETVYNMILVTDLKLTPTINLNYTTSEILALRDFNDSKMLVIYGDEGSEGELELQGITEGHRINDPDKFFERPFHNGNKIVFTYRHSHLKSLRIRDDSGEDLIIIITTKNEAGRFWFKEYNGDVLITSMDYIDDKKTFSSVALSAEYRKDIKDVFVFSGSPLKISGMNQIQQWDKEKGYAVFKVQEWGNSPSVAADLSSGKTITDFDEVFEEYDTTDWVGWEGEPKKLESMGVYKGHVWYRAYFPILNGEMTQMRSNPQLYIEHATDIIGIYINGEYITTVSPVGSEIDNHSISPRYNFKIPLSCLKLGVNTISFRTEIWGHGSFAFPRGNLIGTNLKIPALGMDSMKGLYGYARFEGKDLIAWQMRKELSGEINGYYMPDYDDSDWEGTTIPVQLNPGDVRWYRTTFKTHDVLDEENYFAPVVLSLIGKNTKATIFLNGRLIGRWISDEEWLRHGTWLNPIRNMWQCLDSNQFPILSGLLKKDGSDNVLAMVFEDTAINSDEPGLIENISIIHNQDEFGDNGSETVNVVSIKKRMKVVIK